MIIKGDIEGATSRAELYRDILGKDNFYLEIQHNSIPEQAIVNKNLVDIAKKANFSLIAKAASKSFCAAGIFLRFK